MAFGKTLAWLVYVGFGNGAENPGSKSKRVLVTMFPAFRQGHQVRFDLPRAAPHHKTRLRGDGWPVGGGGTFILHGRHLQIFAISLYICAGVNLSFTFLLRPHPTPPRIYIYILYTKLLQHVINVASRASSE